MSNSVLTRRNKFLTLAAVVLAAGLGALPASAAFALGTLDQQATGSSQNFYYSMNGGYVVGQMITPGVSGQLDRITMDVFRGPTGSPGALTADMYAADTNGFPTGAVLASTSAPESSILSTVTTVPFDFGTPATVTAGNSYVVIFGNTGTGEYLYMNATTIPAGAKGIKPGVSLVGWVNYIGQNPAETSFRFATYITPAVTAEVIVSEPVVADPTLAFTGIDSRGAVQLGVFGVAILLAGGVGLSVARARSRKN
jgi:hypothetical protein